MSNSNKNSISSSKIIPNNANIMANDGYSPRDGLGYKQEKNSNNSNSRTGGYSPGYKSNSKPTPPPPPPPPTFTSNVPYIERLFHSVVPPISRDWIKATRVPTQT
jgi:hypothetical protein